jgi:hypothetical protein
MHANGQAGKQTGKQAKRQAAPRDNLSSNPALHCTRTAHLHGHEGAEGVLSKKEDIDVIVPREVSQVN